MEKKEDNNEVLQVEDPQELEKDWIKELLFSDLIDKLTLFLRGKLAKSVYISKKPFHVRIDASFSLKHVEIASILVGITSNIHVSTITARDAGDDFELIYHLLLDYSLPLDLAVNVPKEPSILKPKVPSMVSILPAANIYEREVHDLIGIEFTGHPRLQRLVLPDDWPDDQFPLRKDFEIKPPRGE